MAKESLIRFSKGDKISLGIAISKFNKKVSQLEAENFENLPQTINYKKMVDDINTRREFNKNMNMLKSFLKDDALDLSDSKLGQPLTNWEKENFFQDIREAKRTIRSQLRDLEQGFGMGTRRFNELTDTLESFNNLDNLTASEFKRIRERANIYGSGSYELDRAIIFRDNFIEAFKDFNYKDIDKLLEKVKSFRNPLDFWDFIKDSNLSDLKIYYDIKKGLVTFGNDEENFIEDLKELGIV